MKERSLNTNPIRILQTLLWYLLVIWFAVVVVLYAIDSSLAGGTASVGLLILLCSIPLRAAVMAEQFRRAKLFKLAILGYLLILLLLTTVLTKYIIK